MAATRDAGELAVAFTRVLRGVGMNVPTSSTIAFGEALAATGLDDRDVTYWAGQATLLRRPEDREVYDKAFKVFWEHAVGAPVEDDDEILRLTLAVDTGDEDEGDDDA